MQEPQGPTDEAGFGAEERGVGVKGVVYPQVVPRVAQGVRTGRALPADSSGLISGLMCPSPSLMLRGPHTPSPGEQVGLIKASPTQWMADTPQHPDPVMETSALAKLRVKQIFTFNLRWVLQGSEAEAGTEPSEKLLLRLLHRERGKSCTQPVLYFCSF